MRTVTDIIAQRASSAALVLERFGVAFGQRVVLSRIDLELPRTGVVALVGPVAAGKSTLLRTLAGFNKNMPAVRTWGECFYDGRALGDDHRPVLVSQNSRLLTSTLLENILQETPERFASTAKEKRRRALGILERVGLEGLKGDLESPVVALPLVVQRLIAIARLLPKKPSLLLLDEPTYGLTDDEAERILAVVREEGRRRSIAIVLHNQKQVRSLEGMVALLAGGVIQEYQPADAFFANPVTPAGREFVDTGTCLDPSPDAREDDLTTGVRPRLHAPPAEVVVSSESLGPRGFAWLLPGRLAGTPRPGVVADIDYDLKALRRVGVSVLVSLTTQPLDPEALRRMDMQAHWFPVPDMCAPSLELAEGICLQIEKLLNESATVAVHCRAGLGRTGTILAAYLIWCGRSAVDALEEVRRIEPKWVQSDPQVQFLAEFAHSLRMGRAQLGTTVCPA